MNEPCSEEAAEEVSGEAEGQGVPQQENSSLRQQISASVQFTGPLPPPSILEQYNRSLPSAAERLMLMAEREQEHRHKMQEKLVDSQILDVKQERSERRLGQIFGLVIGVVALIGGVVTVFLGKSTADSIAGGVFGTSGVAGIVSVFVLGRKEQQNAQYQQLKSSDIEDEAGTI